jgi:hypothetical protein
LSKAKFESHIFAITQLIKNPHKEVEENSFKNNTYQFPHSPPQDFPLGSFLQGSCKRLTPHLYPISVVETQCVKADIIN